MTKLTLAEINRVSARVKPLRETVRDAFIHAYNQCAGDIEATGIVLEIARATAYRHAKKYGLIPDNDRDEEATPSD